jgi:hypothetical protein
MRRECDEEIIIYLAINKRDGRWFQWLACAEGAVGITGGGDGREKIKKLQNCVNSHRRLKATAVCATGGDGSNADWCSREHTSHIGSKHAIIQFDVARAE